MNTIGDLGISYSGTLRKFGWVSIFVFILFSGCDDAPVDKNYTRSREYRSFQEKQEREYAAQVESRKSLEKYLSAYRKCDKGQIREFPLQIDYTFLEKFGSECDLISDSFHTDFTSESFGYSQLNDVSIRWILLKRVSAYDNWEFLAATYLDTALVSFQKLGTFRKNLSQNISTAISVSRKGDLAYISSRMNRGFTYPFRYENVIDRTYVIDSDGRISRLEKSIEN